MNSLVSSVICYKHLEQLNFKNTNNKNTEKYDYDFHKETESLTDKKFQTH